MLDPFAHDIHPQITIAGELGAQIQDMLLFFIPGENDEAKDWRQNISLDFMVCYSFDLFFAAFAVIICLSIELFLLPESILNSE